jgi:DNA-binding beta-propeller fold protein YncE
MIMNRRSLWNSTMATGVGIALLFGTHLLPVRGDNKHETSFAAVPSEKNGQDLNGPYDVVPNWPKPLSQLPGHEKWTWGGVEGTFAESPDRVFILMRGEIPLLKRPVNTAVPQFGPGMSFPVNGVPFRNASQGPVAALDNSVGHDGNWQGKFGVDARWEDCIVVVDSNGKIVETWSQWDKILRDPHAVYISPYDPEKNVWVVDADSDVIYKFSHDGKQLLQTIGVRDEAGNDDKHFNRPTFMAWMPDGTMFVADGYVNTRVVKLDKNGNYLTAWGEKGTAPNETRPNYFNTVHGIVIDPASHRVFVNDRENRRTQVFDENGKFLDQWSFGTISSVYTTYMSADHHLWAADATTSKILEYDLDGHYLYSWGSLGDFPGGLFGPHAISVDQEGNLYVGEVENGRVQKFRPRKGANPDLLVGQPVRSAWK